MLIHSKRQTQIKAKVGTLLFNEAPNEVVAEYSNYSNIFSVEYAAKLPENTEINEHTILLEEDKQSLFEPIYSLRPIELETLKIYIKINLANGFIRPSKSLVRAPILFDKKPDRSFYFYIDYWSLNNLTIKNRYSLSLIGKSLDQLGQIKQFT